MKTRDNIEKRQRWIRSTIAMGGRVNRRAIMQQFGICRSVARDDIALFKAMHPGLTAYCDRTKVHRLVEEVADRTCLPVLALHWDEALA